VSGVFGSGRLGSRSEVVRLCRDPGLRRCRELLGASV
jgi:hypothetical protein